MFPQLPHCVTLILVVKHDENSIGKGLCPRQDIVPPSHTCSIYFWTTSSNAILVSIQSKKNSCDFVVRLQKD